LQVAAREFARLGLHAGCLDVVFGFQASSKFVSCHIVQLPFLTDWLLVVALHNDVAGKRKVWSTADPYTILRDVGKTLADGEGRRFIGNILAFQPNSSRARTQTGDNFNQFALTIACNASDAKNFTLVQCQVHITQSRQVFVIQGGNIFQAQDLTPSCLFTFMQIKNHFTTNHQRGKTFTSKILQVHAFCGHAPAPQNCQFISNVLDLGEFVADEGNGFALRGHSLERFD